MILIPSLEILNGNVVRLVGGADGKPTVLSDDPFKTVRDLRQSGAMFFHMVDLDSAFGQGNNNEALAKLADDMIPFQVRGGIASAERADEILQLGADRVVLGSLPYSDPKAAKELVKRFGMRVITTLDVKDEHVLVGGNEEQDESEGIELSAAIKKLKAVGAQQVIYNSVERAGEDAEMDLDKLGRVLQEGSFQVHARCTIHKPDELAPLRKLGEQGLIGVILNHALAKDSAPFADVIKATSEAEV